MRKFFFACLALVIGVSAFAQTKIQLPSTDKAECVKSDMTSLKASFSFSTIQAENMETKGGQFSWLSLPNTVIGGNEGDPQIPVVNELIAVPFGAQPRIEVKSYSTTDYRLADYGIQTVIPRQLPVRKSQRFEDMPFIMNEAAYQTRGLHSEPQAMVQVVGTMRGVRLGKMTIEPVSYDPVNNTLRVFNDIEVEVHFDGADAAATEKMLVDTYSPYFDVVYKQLFNGRAVLDAYSAHPDLYSTPVKMLVVTTSAYTSSTAFQNWLTWKKQKGIDVDIYTVTSSTSASTIKSNIYSRYNANHPSFLVIVGDETVVTYYTLFDFDSSYGTAASDLEYASVDGDVYHDMFLSRMPVSSTTELSNLVNKILTYEKYTMSDPSYLNETLLIAGWDDDATSYIGGPTIQYAKNYYFNTSHGITPHVFITTASGQTTCYNYINNVGFVNYTAHGDIQKWHDPQFTNTNVNSLTNNDKYFWAMGNCCLTANFKNSSNSQTCFGEAMVRAANKGAFGYIGSVPESLWYEDYYFAVGATSTFGQMPTQSQTKKGVYDAMFDDTGFNTLNSVPYIGNVAVTYAHAGNYTSSVNDEYYWRAYYCFGDGSVMPYLKQPAANNVSHSGALPIGSNTYTVSADAGSYVSITVNNEIIGVDVVPSNGTVDVQVDAQYTTGTAMIVVTRAQRQPYIGTINIVGGTQYNITVTQPQHGTISAPTQAYANANVTLQATPETGYCLSGWDVRDSSNHSITVTNNKFTMPESDVTVTATFVEGLEVTLASVMNGSISADPLYALQGMTINLTASPASGYEFDSWVVYKTGDVNTSVTVNGNSFTMPNYPVTVSAIFNQIVSNDQTVGSGTSNNGYIPTYAYYKQSLSQQIYKPAEVGAAGKITKVAFKVSNSKSTQRSIDIYMSHTSTSTFSSNSSWIAQSTSYRVFSGSVNFLSSGWTTITLDTPFEYNGTSNLLLTVDDNTGSYVTNSSDSPQFYVYSTSAYTALYAYDDNTNFNPASVSTSGVSGNNRLKTNNQVVFTKEVASTEGYLSVSPSALSGFEAIAGNVASTPQSVGVIGNNLQANLTVSAPTGFEVCATSNGTYSSTLTLTPSNGSLRSNVYVRLSSNVNPGDYNGNLTLTSSTATTTVSLSGTVIPGNLLYAVTVTANPAAGGTVTGAGEYTYGTPVTLTATPNEGYSFVKWTNNGLEVSNNPNYSFTVTGATDFVAHFSMNSYLVTAAPMPAACGNVTIDGVYNGNEEEYFFDFEDGTPQGWTILQGTDGNSPHNWMHSSDFTAEDLSSGHGNSNSDGFMLSESYVYLDGGIGVDVYPDNYLISPRIQLGGTISFWVTNGDSELGAEHFALAVSTNSNTDVNDFTTIQQWTLNSKAGKTGNTRSVDNGVWYQYSIDLSAYSGLGYLAIHHFNCTDQWLLGIDDISIVEGYTGTCNATYNHGETCTVAATPNDGYLFTNWTENGSVVSSNTSYTFTVTEDRNLVANFTEAEPVLYNVLVSVNPANTGTVTGGGTYAEGQTCYLFATPAEGYVFIGWMQYVNGVGTLLSENATYSFTVTSDINVVAYFELQPVEQNVTLITGWNWWSTYIDITLEQLENSLGTEGVSINNAALGSVIYNENYQAWAGDFTNIDPARMYQIETNSDEAPALSGQPLDPADYPITINKGTNWIGYPVQNTMTVTQALVNHTPTRGDVIKSKTKTSMFTTKWSGTFNLEPGMGYIYISKVNAPSFVYPNSTRGNAPEAIEESTYWTAQRARFANNMSVIATLELDGTISDDIEVGAFVDGECRDAVKLTYIDDLGQYYAILTVSGNNGETVSFKALRNGNVIDLDETVTIHIDDIVGDVDQPFILHATGDAMTLFPNPAAKGETVRIALPANVDLNGATVEIYNALGSKVRMETLSNNRGELTGLQTPGIYTVKVSDQKGNTYINKLIVK